jgi:hypothetical protein
MISGMLSLSVHVGEGSIVMARVVLREGAQASTNSEIVNNPAISHCKHNQDDCVMASWWKVYALSIMWGIFTLYLFFALSFTSAAVAVEYPAFRCLPRRCFFRNPGFHVSVNAKGNPPMEYISGQGSPLLWIQPGGIPYQTIRNDTVVDGAVIIGHNAVAGKYTLGEVVFSGVVHEGCFLFQGTQHEGGEQRTLSLWYSGFDPNADFGRLDNFAYNIVAHLRQYRTKMAVKRGYDELDRNVSQIVLSFPTNLSI